MLNVIGALSLGVICTVDFVVLIGLAKIERSAKVAAFTIAGIWVALLVAIGAVGGFGAGVLGPFPAPMIPFLILATGALVAWFAWPEFRRALLSLPLAGLIGIHAFRILGVYFLILHAQGRLAAPFATSAGWGDIATGIIAIPLAALIASKGTAPRWLLRVWNAFGTLDLLTAISLGALSAPGTPFRVFTEAPGTMAMGTLPWAGIPALLVPLYLTTHFVIAMKLRAMSTAETGSSERNGSAAPGAVVRRVA